MLRLLIEAKGVTQVQTAKEAGIAESTISVFPDNPQLSEGFTFGESETSLTGGVQAGWQRQWGKMVLGVELGFNVLRFKSTSDAQVIPGIETDVLAAVIAHDTFGNDYATRPGDNPERHGPYWRDRITPASYDRVDPSRGRTRATDMV